MMRDPLMEDLLKGQKTWMDNSHFPNSAHGLTGREWHW